MEEKIFQYRIYQVIESKEEHITTRPTQREAHDYVSNSVHNSDEEMAHRDFFYRRFYRTTDDSNWHLDTSFSETGVGAKTAKGLLEDIEAKKREQ